MILVDTDVLIDCLRGLPSARRWLDQSSQQTFAIPGVVAMELLIGCRNQTDLVQVQSFLHRFHVSWPEAGEFAKAFEILATHRLSSGLSIPDCLVAAMALTRRAPLLTFNLKHFQMIPGLDVQTPYQRT